MTAPTAGQPFNFAQHLLSLNTARADKAAFIDDLGTLTYGQLDERVRRLAAALRATGLKRDSLRALWSGLRRPMQDPDSLKSPFGRVMYVYDLLSNAKAQTVLRYWNWSLTSGIGAGDSETLDPSDVELEFLPARRSAALVFGRRN